ncbi:hypothetical protein FOCC_FOCC012040 [Frankliniella occidentalis]|nr:hypothetical protein FOCC_FOCC012040 [Frankliniella occidentalis]
MLPANMAERPPGKAGPDRTTDAAQTTAPVTVPAATTTTTTSTVESRGGDFDPFALRDIKHPTNEVDSLVHLMKGSMGSGILGMPKAVQNGGLWFSLAVTPVVGFICTYCVHMLVVSAHELYHRERVPQLDFSEVAELGFKTGPKRTRFLSRIAKHSVNWLMSLNLLGTCCIYLVFIASNMKQVMEHHEYPVQDLRVYIVCTLPFVLLFIVVRDLKYLSPSSMLANALIMVGMIICFYYMLRDVPSPSERKAVGHYSTVPLYFSTVIFALEGIGVVMPLENNMKNPRRFPGCPGVLGFGFTVTTVLYTTVGFFGYLKYGDETSDAITLNLPVAEGLAQSVKIMMSIAIFFTYFLQFYVPFEIIMKAVERRYGEQSVRNETLLRLFLGTLTVVIAVAVPTLEVFMSLIGALCLASLGLILPPAIDMVVFWDKEGGRGRGNWKVYKNIAIISFGVCALILGTTTSLINLVNFYANTDTLRT